MAKNFSRFRRGSVRSMPLTLGLISTPRRPSLFTQRSSSATARSTCCSGTVPSATKRSGQRRDDLGEPIVHHARQLDAQLRVGPVVALVRRGRHRLDVDAHAIHVLRAASRSSRASAPRSLHLLDVDFARQRVGEHDGRLVLRRIQVRDLGGDRRVEIVAMDIDAQALALAVADDFGRRRRHALRLLRPHGAGVARGMIVRGSVQPGVAHR